jgi:enterochelin esterase-like enzyme
MGLSLMGLPLLVLLVALTVGVSALAIVGVPRLAASTPTRRRTKAGVRVVALLLSQALAVGVVADVINRQNAFYVSWGDLLGTAKITSVAFHGGTGTPLVAPAAKPTPNPLSHGHYRASGHVWVVSAERPWPKTAQVVRDRYGWTPVNFSMRGPLSGITGNISVHLPPTWRAHPLRPYPLVEVLGGFPGSVTTIFKQLGVGQVFEKAVNLHQYRPTVVVAVQNHGARDSECINSAAGQWGTWLAYDVPNWLSTHVGVSTSRAARAAVGFSMGGWCANMLAVKYSRVFGVSASLGGYMQPQFDPPNPVKLAPAVAAQYNLAHILRTNPPNVRMWVQTDTSDPISYASSVQFAKHPVKAPASLDLFITHGAGHNLRNISYCLPYAVNWLKAVAPAFAY